MWISTKWCLVSYPVGIVAKHSLAFANKEGMESTESFNISIKLAIAQWQPKELHSVLYTSEWLEKLYQNNVTKVFGPVLNNIYKLTGPDRLHL